ncbi:hypothetical protein PInf_015224 [Phytophthora infestans]|nr:hypothetical protein PInf_015224 [Phytophthora infestans]
MDLSPFAFDIVEKEFNYATSDRADYDERDDRDMAVLTSRQAGIKHTLCTKIVFFSLDARLPVNGIAVGDVSEGIVSTGIIKAQLQVKALNGNAKYSSAKRRKEVIVSVLSK